MTESTALPLLGAALRLPELPAFVEWLAADQRDLELQDPSYSGFLDEDWLPAAKQGRALLDSHGYRGRLGVHAAYEGIDLGTHDKHLRAAIIDRYRQSLEFGAEFGATHLVIHSPFALFGSPLVYYMTPPERQYIGDGVRAVLEPLLPMAEQMGCAFVMECIADANPLPLVELVRSFQSPLVRVSIDVGHAFIMQQFGGATPDQWVLEAGDLLEHVHVQDTDGHGDRHWGIGDGNINWRAFFKMLGKLDHSPRLILELISVEDIHPSVNWLAAQGLAR